VYLSARPRARDLLVSLSRSHQSDATTRAVKAPSHRGRDTFRGVGVDTRVLERVTPKPFSIFRAKRRPSCLSWVVYGGALRFTRFMAESCRLPKGSRSPDRDRCARRADRVCPW